MTRRVLALLAGHVALAGAAVALARAHHFTIGAPWRVAAFVFAFALVGLLPMHVELTRGACTVTMVEAVLVLALFWVGPLGVVIGATGGELLACLLHQKSPLKIAYNFVATGLASLVAATAFAELGQRGMERPLAWGSALLAAGVLSIFSQSSTAAALAVVEHRRFHHVLMASLPMTALASAVSASIGLAVVALAGEGLGAPFLMAPLIVTAALETRRVAAHRTEHLRFERLYSSSARTTGLQEFLPSLAVAAGEARSLVTGAAGLCCAADRTGAWQGMLVDDRGSRPAPPEVVTAVADLVEQHGAGELPVGELPATLQQAFPASTAAVVAGTDRLVLAVFREIEAGGVEPESRVEVLAAFVGHAALVVTNGLLYEEVAEALERQVDLGRRKDDFVAAVSHELRTPLASMLASVSTLRRLDERIDGEAKGRFFEMAIRQGKRLERLIEELLLVGAVEHREERCTIGEVDLASLMDELAAEVSELAGDRLQVTLLPPAARIATDEHKLLQILLNLVENAAKYAPTGPIEVTARRALRPLRGQEHFVFMVVDHGPGIPAEDRERVFERFVQLDQSSTRTQGGTGLGLYLCRKLADLLGAWLTLSETAGGGCTFTLILPCAPGEPTAGVPDNVVALLAG
jgi:signal transduction histidine kinase